MARHKNIFTDCSGVKRFDLLKAAYERAGARKILYGSDGPWLHPGVELSKIFYLKAPPKEEQLMLSGNFLRLTQKSRKQATHLAA